MGVTDPPSKGQVDLPDNRGAVGTYSVQSDGAIVPFRAVHYMISSGAGSTVAQITSNQSNDDGTGGGIAFHTVAAGDPLSTSNVAGASGNFQGSLFGVRLSRDTVSQDILEPIVDGVIYPPLGQQLVHLDNQVPPTTLADGHSSFTVTDSLPTRDTDGRPVTHTWRLLLTSDPYQTRDARASSMVLDRKAGYRDPLRLDYILGPVALTGTLTAIGSPSSSAGFPRSYKKFRIVNTLRDNTGTGIATRVTIQFNSFTVQDISLAAPDATTDATKQTLQATAAEWEISNPGVNNSVFWTASATPAIIGDGSPAVASGAVRLFAVVGY